MIQAVDPQQLDGSLVCVPVSNVPAFLRHERLFPDGQDLDQVMPGDPNGNEGSIYAYRFASRLINELDYLIDIHTASFGNENSFFVIANTEIAEVSHMAWLQNPQFIVHNKTHGSLRQTAEDLGVHAIKVEVGDPHSFQKEAISVALDGIINMLVYLDLLEGDLRNPNETIVACSHSYGLHTDRGGLLSVYPKLAEQIKQGQLVARVSNVFGDIIKEYHAPEDGVVIGRNIDSVNRPGGRILHLGIVA